MTLGARDDNPSPLLGRAPLGPHVDGHLDVGHGFAREIDGVSDGCGFEGAATVRSERNGRWKGTNAELRKPGNLN